MALILNIETSTTLCSVSLSDGEKIIQSKEINEGYTHTENLHSFIHKILSEAGVSPKQLNAIAVGIGPGSYTGLRIGVSAAKGLSYALDIPVIGLNSLMILAQSANQKINHKTLLCPLFDARRMEVYCAILDQQMNYIKETSAQIISTENISYFMLEQPICFFGDGMNKCRSILEKIPNAYFLEDQVPSSKSLASLAFKKFINKEFENTAYFEPYYLKDFILGSKN